MLCPNNTDIRGNNALLKLNTSGKDIDLPSRVKLMVLRYQSVIVIATNADFDIVAGLVIINVHNHSFYVRVK